VTHLPRSRRGALWRFALAGVIVIGFTATTTALAGLLQVKQIAKYLSATPSLPHAQVTVANPGDPQTLLLIGSDHRGGTSWSSANTDTMLLVRLDPDSSTINFISLPRDLEVQIPGYGTAKLNAAYSLGGPNLLLETIRENVFPQLQVSHIIDVNFGGFEDLVDAIGCVYSDVDHRYYNNTSVTDYSSIDIQPGYQPLCDADALAFVRFRHTDNDIVRNARQQDFLRWAKDAYSEADLIANEGTLVKIFGEHTQTDHNLHTTDGLINLFDVVAFSDGHQIKQIPFPAILQPCAPAPPPGSNQQQPPCYVNANPGPEQAAYNAFMAPTTAQQTAASNKSAAGESTGTGQSHGAGKPKPTPGLTTDVSDGKAQAKALGNVGMPVYFPRVILSNTSYCTATNPDCTVEEGQTPAEAGVSGGYPRAYLIHDESGNPHFAYRMTLAVNADLGEYYGVQGTTWRDPPILNNPTETKTVNGRQLLLYVNAGKISLVAWHTSGGVYWISNSLNDVIGNQQMVTMAGSLMLAT
jgi:polyisoprenyl-teichoic acid--peptidoglycan teichoic acid transferase